MDKEPIKYKTQVVPVSSIEVHPMLEELNIETSELSKSEAKYFNYSGKPVVFEIKADNMGSDERKYILVNNLEAFAYSKFKK